MQRPLKLNLNYRPNKKFGRQRNSCEAAKYETGLKVLLNSEATSDHVRLIPNARQLVAQAGKTQSVNSAVVGL